MAGSGQGIPITGVGVGMTRADLKKYARFLLAKFDTATLPDKHLLQYSLEDALQRGYEKVARETKALLVNYDLTAVVNTHTYEMAEFGASSAGARIFEITHLAYDDVPLVQRSMPWLDKFYNRWRTNGNGTPVYWLPWGDGKIRLYPKPATAGTIYLEGFEVPDPAAFDADTESPALHPDDQPLIAIYAAMLVAVGSPDDNSMRATYLWPMWESGITAAKTRIQESGIIIVGRWKNTHIDTDPSVDDTVTLI